jgi:peroxiredoxin
MVQKQAHIGISVITPQEIQSEVTLFKARGNYTVPMFADANGTLVNPLEVRVVPMHFIIDKNGKIRKILYGVQTYEDLLKALGEIR